MAEKVNFNIDKDKNFSEWFTDIIQKAELADLRYNIKGFLVFQPWSVLAMEKMYAILEKTLQRKNHKPYWFPTLIPEMNFKKESSHLGGFTPEVFWVTQGGEKKLEEKYALRPTSETAFYQMFALWLRSYKDLPMKTYQRANIFRYDTKATRPFLRSREFHWIETHCAHASEEDAMNQVYEDMETTQEFLHDTLGIPFMFFERPSWDKFPGAHRTFAADVLNPDGKVIQQPSTHLISQQFSKAFDVKFKDKDEKEKLAWMTCYGPAISRIFASVVIMHGDNKGLVFPWKIAPVQVIIVPVNDNPELLKEAEKIKKQLQEKDLSVEIDTSDKSFGEKLFFWEMKGVPFRIELGMKELKENKATIFRRDTNKKESAKLAEVADYITKNAKKYDENLIETADKLFKNRVANIKSKDELKKVVNEGKIARVGFCSMNQDGEKCAEFIEKNMQAEVRGTRLDEKKKDIEKCVICGKKANHIAYVARSY